MGICKCKKRTDLFCFVHRKAVCETCICSDHQVCIVGSYFNWLSEQPEIEAPLCGICKGDLTPENMVRFTCLDMFHPECIDVYASSMPANTALAGYTCPTCDKPILPTPGNTSVLAQQIRKAFANSPWATRVMGSADEHENIDLTSPSDKPKFEEKHTPESHSIPSTDSYSLPTQTIDKPNKTELDPLDPLSYHPPPQNTYPAATTINIDNSSGYGMTSHRKAPKPVAGSGSMPYVMDDEDEDKYRKKGFMQLFTALGLVTTPTGDSKRGVQLDMKRIVTIFAALSTLFILYFLYSVIFSVEDPVTTTID